MRLPHHDKVIVPKRKIVDYLLSFEHRDGRSKADFFTRFGFSADRWQQMAEALEGHAADHDVSKVEESPFGMRYVIEGPMTCPDSRTADVRTIWFVEKGEERPRFVTAYPLRRRTK